VGEREVLKGVKEDVDRKRFHVACNRVFEYVHAKELKRVKEEGGWKAEDLDVIVHPNTWFKRSYLLKHGLGGEGDVDMGG
jgi:DNA primase large subunit